MTVGIGNLDRDQSYVRSVRCFCSKVGMEQSAPRFIERNMSEIFVMIYLAAVVKGRDTNRLPIVSRHREDFASDLGDEFEAPEWANHLIFDRLLFLKGIRADG